MSKPSPSDEFQRLAQEFDALVEHLNYCPSYVAFAAFRKPLRADACKTLNLYGEKWAVQVFQKQVFLKRPHATAREPKGGDHLSGCDCGLSFSWPNNKIRKKLPLTDSENDMITNPEYLTLHICLK